MIIISAGNNLWICIRLYYDIYNDISLTEDCLHSVPQSKPIVQLLVIRRRKPVLMTSPPDNGHI